MAYNVSVTEGNNAVSSISPAATAARPEASVPEAGIEITANLPGNVYKILVSQGDSVNEHDTIIVLEAMKMETNIVAPSSGTISSIEVQQGDVVTAGQLLATM